MNKWKAKIYNTFRNIVISQKKVKNISRSTLGQCLKTISQQDQAFYFIIDRSLYM